MSAKGRLIIIAFVAVALLSGFGLLRLFALRFEKGDMFPPYSSLRSDPLGCKALFMALERSTGLDARRNFHAPDKLKGEQGRTIYWLGAGEALLTTAANREAKELETLAREGNRLVIAFGKDKGKAVAAGKREAETDDEDTDTDEAEEAVAPESSKEAATAQTCASTVGVWGVVAAAFDLPADKVKDRPRAALTAPANELPPTIPLLSRRHFQSTAQEWRPVYSYNGEAIVLERTIGTGSIVLLADSYLFSNEALRKDRCPGLFAWLQGSALTALFDESHLGVYDTPGVMSLIKKHRLVPFLLALLALAALYVWKSAVPFISAVVPEQERRETGGRESFSGLVNLLRRNIAPADLLGTCFREWSRSFSRELKSTPELAKALQTLLAGEAAKPAGKRDPVAVYRKMAGLLAGLRIR